MNKQIRYNPDEHHRRSIRLGTYDYSECALYFLTICSHKRRCVLGEIINGQAMLSSVGESVRELWLRIPHRFENVDLDQFVVMPNHVHGIVNIVSGIENNVGAIHELPLHIERRRMLVPKIVGYFKMNSAKRVNCLRSTPGLHLWQRNYYERVIRNENELYRIREYIQNNPLNWELDRENPLSKNFDLEHDMYWREIYEPKKTG